MKNEISIEFEVLEYVRKNKDLVNNILSAGIFNSQTLKNLLSAYENLFKATNDIIYIKNIADIYHFYFKNKEIALKYYLEYCSKIHNDSSVYYIISSIYKSKNDNENFKKYMNLAINSSYEKVDSVLPNSDDIVLGVNIGVAAGLSMNDDVKHGVDVYKKIMQFSPTPNNILMPYIDLELKRANQLFEEKNWKEALIKYKAVFNNSRMEEADFIKLISCLSELNEKEIALEYLKKYEETAIDKVRANYVIADLLYFQFANIEEAIERFERYISSNPNDALVCNTLGHLYSTYYNDKFLDKQLEYFKKAQELVPNSKIFNKNLALTYNKLDDFENANKYYEQVMNLNPNNDDKFDYGCFLVQNGQFKDGFKYYANRFLKETKPALYPPMLIPQKELKNKVDIENNIILVQCEQGFGDTIMFSRFVKPLKNLAKKVIFVVQDELLDLFKSSGFEVDLYSVTTDYSKLEYDYHVPLMNLPMFLEIETSNIIASNGYLEVEEKKVQHFAYEFIENPEKIKVGLAYEGYDVSVDLNRDILLEEFLPIINNTDIDVYILQREDNHKQIENLPKNAKVINVGKDFTTFEDTAAAIKNMDLIISTDNVILNLAGALGVKTYGLFNKYAEYRWFKLNGDNVGWYDSVKPYQASEFNNWTDIINKLKKDI